ncbi:hypothetical protein MPNT_190060 [Candidatus Methylacidithermus pantelleriae]|uniref:Uncharacterized protein n=1 Tax=Candidatus Methylacidithermus pantelleriae TaxID=2744239 RepID=A0A8J2BIZ8_9BACT|nr:hypothetical protein MPNT_190060 [Candidatus Methylacidithermus pantelleriae]
MPRGGGKCSRSGKASVARCRTLALLVPDWEKLIERKAVRCVLPMGCVGSNAWLVVSKAQWGSGCIPSRMPGAAALGLLKEAGFL